MGLADRLYVHITSADYIRDNPSTVQRNLDETHVERAKGNWDREEV